MPELHLHMQIQVMQRQVEALFTVDIVIVITHFK